MSKKNSKYLIILFLIFFISIGYAYLSSNLSIGGIANIKQVKWNIYFDNIMETKGTNLVVVHPKTTSNKTTSLNYEVTLEDPGDSYSFDVDVVNDGNIDAMVNLITNSFDNLTDDEKKLFDFSITYKDGMKIESKNLLKASSYDTFTITVSYKRDIVIEDLPSEDINLNINIDLEYRQAKEADTKRDDKLKDVFIDKSGNNNNGRAYNGVTLNNDGTVTLDGRTGFINVGYKNYDFGSDLSMVARFKYYSDPPITSKSDRYSILSNGDAAGGGLSVNHGNILYANIYIKEIKSYVAVSYPNSLQTDTWYTVVLTIDSEKLSLYLNGEKVGETLTNGTVKPSPVSICIGANSDYGDTKFREFIDGTFDSALLFDRTLTAEEIATDYAEEVNPTNTDQLLFYYDFK